MATIDNYTIDIKVKGEQDIKNVVAQTEKLSVSMKDMGEKFEAAKSKAEQFAVAIAGVGLIEYIHSIMEAASKTKDLSEAYGLTVETILELEAGFRKAGRGADDMGKMMTVLNQKALEVADGNLATESSFNELGITFDDLKTMSMDEVFLKIAKSMEEGKGSAKSIAAAMDVLGKGAKGVPWGDFVEGIENAKGKMGAAADASIKLDQTMKGLEQSAANIRREFMTLLGPVADLFNKFMEGADNSRLAAIGLATAMAVIGGAVAAKGITLVVDAFKEFALMTGLSAAATSSETTALVANTAATAANATARSTALAAKVASIEASIAEAAATLRGELTSMSEAAAKAVLERNTWRLVVAKGALAEASALETAAVSASAAALTAESVAAGTAATATTAFGTAIGFVMKNLGPIGLAITAITAAWTAWDYLSGKDKAAENAQKTSENLDKVVQKNDSVLDKETKKLNLQAAAEVALRNQYESQALLLNQTEQRLKLQLSLIGSSELEKTAAMANFDAQAKKQQEILKLQQDIKRLETQAANEKDGAEKYGGQLSIMREQLKTVQNQKDKTAELTVELKRQEQAQANLLFGVNLRNKAADDLLKVEGEIATITMTSDEKRIASLQEQIQLEARAEVRRREALLGNNAKLPLEEQIEILHQVEKAYDPIIQKTRELTATSRDFNVGWERAFNQYVDDATNAAKRAENIFNAVTSNMNSAIDKFVDTGKFSFSDFANSVIKDLLKIELKASAMNLWSLMRGGGGGGGGGLLGAVGSLFGFADGGEPPVGEPSIVGERGPEVFIPKTAGTVIPNNMLNQQPQQPVHNTYITNHISAVDAQGVARLFANNRQTLLGSVEQARKELPMRGMVR